MRALLTVLLVLLASTQIYARYSDDVDDMEVAANFREAIVIGSGFGGSVAAFHLATAGVKTLVLERGQSWDTGDGKNEFGPFPTTDNLDQRASWCLPIPALAPLWNPKPVFQGITTGVQSGWSPQRNPYDPGQCILTNGILAVAGSGVGGGSLIYNGVAFYPERKVWEFSRSINANASLYEGLFDELDENYFGRALHRSGASRVPNEIFTHPQWSGARLNQRLSAEAGFGCGHPDIGTNTVPQAVNWEKVKEELSGARAPSVIKGEAWFGNNSGAKRSVDQPDNYLGKAIATGNVELKTYRNVIDISARPTFRWALGKSYLYTVTAQVINAYCQVVGTETYYTTKLFVSAGSLPTTSLLLRAKSLGKLPNLNQYVGTGFSGNGNMGANRFIINGTTVQSAGPASVATHRFKWDPETEVPIAIEVLPQLVGASATNAAQINNINLFTVGVGIPEAGEVGHFTYDSTSDCVTLVWPTGGNYFNSKIYKTFVKAVEEMTPPWISFVPPTLPLPTTVHPLGGMPLGRATDQHCRVQGYTGLYAVDGSVIPFAPGGNPYLTIVAMAERCMDNIIENDFKPVFPWKN